MRRLRSLVTGLRNWFRASSLDRQLQDEVAFHLESRTRDLIRRGYSAGDARRRARVEFGGVESCKEQTREARSPRVLEDLVRDIGYGCRAVFAEVPRWC